MSTGAVPIPTIGQTVSTPSFDVAANPRRAIPMESTAGPALEKAGGDLMDIWQQQQQHQNALNLADRMDKFQQDVGQAKVAALNSGQPAPDMVKNFQDAAGKLTSAYTSDPVNRTIAPQLALLMRQHIADQMQSFPSEATERVMHDLDFKSRVQVKELAQAAAAGYSVSGTTVQNNSDGKTADDHAYAAINGMYPLPARAPENEFFNNEYDHEKAFQRAMLIAQNQPASVTDAYLRGPDGTKLTAEEHTAVTAAATAAIRQPAERLNGANAAMDAQLTQKYLQQAQDGTLDMASFTDDANHERISPAHQRQVLGYKFAPRGNSDAITNMEHQIAVAPDADALETLHGQINGPDNAELYGRGAIPLNAAIENRKRDLNTIEGRQRKQDFEQLKRAYQTVPVPGGAQLYNRMATVQGYPTLSEIQTNAINEYNSASFGIHDPVKLREIRDQVIKNNQPNVKALFPSLDTSKATTPPAMTDDEAKALARAAGLK